MMRVYRITLRALRHDGRGNKFLVVETEHETVAALVAALERGLVAVHCLMTRSCPEEAQHPRDRVFEVTDVFETALRMEEVLRIEVPRVRYVRYEESAATDPHAP